MADKPDPTTREEFQKVVRHFVSTPHRPHEPLKGVAKRDTKREASSRKKTIRGPEK